MQLIDDTLFDQLSHNARANPRGRHHCNLHAQLNDPFQRMVVAMEPASYIRPHRHKLTPKPELLIGLRGAIGVLLFEDDGTISSTQRLPCGIGCDIPAGVWHSIVSLETNSIFLEAKPGPYTPFEPDDFASWAPDPDSAQANDYLGRLQHAFIQLSN